MINLPVIDITSELKEEVEKIQINSCKIRMQTVENANGFSSIKSKLDDFLKRNNFSDMEIRSIYHLMNSYYFMGKKLE